MARDIRRWVVTLLCDVKAFILASHAFAHSSDSDSRSCFRSHNGAHREVTSFPVLKILASRELCWPPRKSQITVLRQAKVLRLKQLFIVTTQVTTCNCKQGTGTVCLRLLLFALAPQKATLYHCQVSELLTPLLVPAGSGLGAANSVQGNGPCAG